MKQDRLFYCPYTDREILEAQTSKEHIIPLALGGHADAKNRRTRIFRYLPNPFVEEIGWGGELDPKYL
jgi:hypothetical protein